MTDSLKINTNLNSSPEKFDKQDLYQEFQSTSGIQSTFLRETSAVIRQKTIKWDLYLKSSVITLDEFNAIAKLNQLSVSSRKEVDEFLQLCAALLRKINKIDTVQWIEVKLTDFVLYLNSLKNKEELVNESSQETWKDLYRIISETLLFNKEDEFIELKSLTLLSEVYCLLKWISSEALKNSLRFVSLELKNASDNADSTKYSTSLDISLQCFHVLLRDAQNRSIVYQDYYSDFELICSSILNVLKNSKNPQLKYHLLLCLWLFTFVKEACLEIGGKKYDFISVIIETMKNSLKEKVIRISLMILKNMLSSSSASKNPKGDCVLSMVGNKLPSVISSFKARKWTDEDIGEDLNFIDAELHSAILQLSTWDEFESELRSGKLEWSPVHLSESFWKQYAQKLTEKDYELVRILCRLMVTATDPTVLAVACYDVGQFVGHFAEGKKVLQELGAKQRVMELMVHDNAEVRYNALVAVQQYMSKFWEY